MKRPCNRTQLDEARATTTFIRKCSLRGLPEPAFLTNRGFSKAQLVEGGGGRQPSEDLHPRVFPTEKEYMALWTTPEAGKSKNDTALQSSRLQTFLTRE